jgi:hypothetical protein
VARDVGEAKPISITSNFPLRRASVRPPAPMDVSEKDAARSKWKLTQRHRRGRGRGGGGAAAAAGRRPGAAAGPELASNADRFPEEEEEGSDGGGALAEGELRSRGADLAELLAAAGAGGAVAAALAARARTDLFSEAGLPPADAAAYQGLAFDLAGLDAALARVPLQALLRLPHEMGYAELGAAEAAEEASGAAQPAARTAVPAQPAPARGGDGAASAELDGFAAAAAPAPQPTRPPPAAAPAADADDAELDALLGLGTGPGLLAAAPRAEAPASAPGERESLEDWLDAL